MPTEQGARTLGGIDPLDNKLCTVGAVAFLIRAANESEVTLQTMEGGRHRELERAGRMSEHDIFSVLHHHLGWKGGRHIRGNLIEQAEANFVGLIVGFVERPWKRW